MTIYCTSLKLKTYTFQLESVEAGTNSVVIIITDNNFKGSISSSYIFLSSNKLLGALCTWRDSW